MRVIPVLDIKGGEVVLASGGDRDHYEPVCTPLIRDSAPAKVVEAFKNLYNFGQFYIADLDALEGRSGNDVTIAKLAIEHPETQFWLDQGSLFGGFDQVRTPNLTPIVGTESLVDDADYEQLTRDSADRSHILSLDRKAGRIIGCEAVYRRHELWPDIVIAMDLSRVGSASGPDHAWLAEIRRRRPDIEVCAAGGIRDANDLRHLASSNVAYALAATSLHNGSITARDLAALDAL